MPLAGEGGGYHTSHDTAGCLKPVKWGAHGAQFALNHASVQTNWGPSSRNVKSATLVLAVLFFALCGKAGVTGSFKDDLPFGRAAEIVKLPIHSMPVGNWSGLAVRRAAEIVELLLMHSMLGGNSSNATPFIRIVLKFALIIPGIGILVCCGCLGCSLTCCRPSVHGKAYEGANKEVKSFRASCMNGVT
eukprot:2763623-Amphidinium_carterae.2